MDEFLMAGSAPPEVVRFASPPEQDYTLVDFCEVRQIVAVNR
jgi:hypothetical protein